MDQKVSSSSWFSIENGQIANIKHVWTQCILSKGSKSLNTMYIIQGVQEFEHDVYYPRGPRVWTQCILSKGSKSTIQCILSKGSKSTNTMYIIQGVQEFEHNVYYPRGPRVQIQCSLSRGPIP